MLIIAQSPGEGHRGISTFFEQHGGDSVMPKPLRICLSPERRLYVPRILSESPERTPLIFLYKYHLVVPRYYPAPSTPNRSISQNIQIKTQHIQLLQTSSSTKYLKMQFKNIVLSATASAALVNALPAPPVLDAVGVVGLDSAKVQRYHKPLTFLTNSAYTSRNH